jgi:hypothetical protein
VSTGAGWVHEQVAALERLHGQGLRREAGAGGATADLGQRAAGLEWEVEVEHRRPEPVRRDGEGVRILGERSALAEDADALALLEPAQLELAPEHGNQVNAGLHTAGPPCS